MRWFYEGRACDTDDLNPKRNTEKAHELGTYSGKIEFVSQSLMAHEPDDEERPPLPVTSPVGKGTPRSSRKKYPLQLIMPHVRYGYHTQFDTHTPWITDIPGNRILKDGYYWHTTRIHPVDAEARGIRNGDIIKLLQ